jgi:shikimate kinase
MYIYTFGGYTMNILLFGVSNVGKTVTGKLLAQRLGYDFYDLDDETKKQLNTTLEIFVSTGTLQERDKVRCDLITSLIARTANKVIAISPLSYFKSIHTLLSSPDIVSIELIDSAENIFDRLVFSDENDIIYKDDDYKNQHKDYYLHDISEDLLWYGSLYSDLKYHFHISGRLPEAVIDALVTQYHLHIKES